MNSRNSLDGSTGSLERTENSKKNFFIDYPILKAQKTSHCRNLNSLTQTQRNAS